MRILIAEDNPATLRLLFRILTRNPRHQVDTVEDGRQLVKFWKQRRHEIIISDVDMPLQDGISACQDILRMDPSVRVIMMSGSDELARWVEESGLGPCLKKPLSKDALLARLS